MNKRLRLPLALSLALGSSSAFALGLGQIEVTSALNQPLAAEIPVLSTLSGETDALVVRLAPPEALARVGLPAPTGVAANLQFALDTNSRGQTVIRVTTPSKVNDPFVTFLLEVDWGKGKILREYTVLLDPPTMAAVRSAPIASAPVMEELPPTSEPLPEALPPPPMEEPSSAPTPVFEPIQEPPAEPAPEPVAEAPVDTPPEPTPEPEPAPTPTRTDTYGPVASGETLWSIAQYARPDDSVSMNQMMLSLLHANPDAFIGQNINRLKKGAILRIPAREEAMAIAAAEAAATVREQMQSWRQTQPSVVQPAEPEPTDTSPSRPVSTSPTTADSRLELVPPKGSTDATGAQSGASVAGEGRELRAELARSKEEISTLSQENVDLKSRVGELENIQQDSTRLLALKDSELAAAQQRLAELQAQPAAEPAATDAVPADGSIGTEPTDGTAATTDATVTDTAPTTDATDAGTADAGGTPTETPDASATPTEATPASTPSETAPLETPAETPPPPAAAWYMSPWMMGGAGLVLVGLLALVLGRRKKPAVATSGAARYGAGEMASSIAAVKASAATPAKAVVHKPETPKVDRATELAEAVARDPANLARHLELVRHHYDAGDAAGFEHAAEAMYSRVYDPDHLAWKQVVAMGHEIAPEHPLFVHDVAVPAVAVPTPPPAPVAVREVNWGASAAAAADSGKTQQMRVDEVKSAQKAAAKPAPAAPAPAPRPEPKVEAAPELTEFSFEPVPSFDAEPEPEPKVDSLADTGGFIDADAASTKLELARAYLDMGDVEGARGMLEEVVSEGNPGQRAEAKRLLDEIR